MQFLSLVKIPEIGCFVDTGSGAVIHVRNHVYQSKRCRQLSCETMRSQSSRCRQLPRETTRSQSKRCRQLSCETMRSQSKRCRQLSWFEFQTCILCTLFLSVTTVACARLLLLVTMHLAVVPLPLGMCTSRLFRHLHTIQHGKSLQVYTQ